MKTYLLRSLLLLGFLSCAWSCSNEDVGFDDPDVGIVDIDDLVVSDYAGEEDWDYDQLGCEKWDGEGAPSWIELRWFIWTAHSGRDKWHFSSYMGSQLIHLYKFTYKGNLLAAVTYDSYVTDHEAGTVCFADDGRLVDFDKVKSGFAKNAELIWTNQLDGENIPQTADLLAHLWSRLDQATGWGKERAKENADRLAGYMADPESLAWLQEVVDGVCADIREPDRVLCSIGVGGAIEEDDSFTFVVDYEYCDPTIGDHHPIRVVHKYTPSGDLISTSTYGWSEFTPYYSTSIWIGSLIFRWGDDSAD